MTNNFRLIEQYFKDNDLPQHNESGLLKHYVVELISRGKDNPDMPAANRHFKNYYFPCLDKFQQYEPEIKAVCDALHMRAYVSVNYKMYDQVLKDLVAESARHVAEGNVGKPYAIYEHCSGKYVNRKDKKYNIDVDEEHMQYFDEILNHVSEHVIIVVPTKSGKHIITKPFNVYAFQNHFKNKYNIDVDVKKNHLTLLYENL